MKSVNDKIADIRENLKEIASKYVPFYKKQTVSKENTEKPSEQSCREMYDNSEVNQSFMNISSF